MDAEERLRFALWKTGLSDGAGGMDTAMRMTTKKWASIDEKSQWFS